jgi:hypothetical protein
MTYDVTLGKCVLFGGNTNLGGTAYVNDTWTWDGANWVQLAPATSPSLRGRGFFSYDPTRLQAIYYGGRNASTALADTWKWDGTNWTQIVTVTRPGSLGVGGLFAYGCTYDLLRDRHVVFGGTRTGATLATVWEFDGVDWLQRGTGPLASRTGPAMAFVPATGKTCCYGGFQILRTPRRGQAVHADDDFTLAIAACLNDRGDGGARLILGIGGNRIFQIEDPCICRQALGVLQSL